MTKYSLNEYFHTLMSPFRLWQDVTEGLFFSVLGVPNKEFSFSQTDCLPRVKERRVNDYLLIASEENWWINHFPRALAHCVTQWVSSSIRNLEHRFHLLQRYDHMQQK